jgi:hypothetical protein
VNGIETPCALWLPVANWVNILLAAGAEVIPLGRLGYDVDSGVQHPHPARARYSCCATGSINAPGKTSSQINC